MLAGDRAVGLEPPAGTRSCPDPTARAHRLSFAPALPREPAERREAGYSEPTSASSWKADRFTGKDFSLQPDGSLRCPAGKSLFCGERRPEADGSLRLVYEARIADCRACSLREQCVEVSLPQALPPEKAEQTCVLTRAQRAHYRLDRQSRLLRNARSPEVAPPTMTLHGVPDHFALFLGLRTA